MARMHGAMFPSLPRTNELNITRQLKTTPPLLSSWASEPLAVRTHTERAVPAILLVYAAWLTLFGALGAWSSGWRAMHSLYSSAGGAAAICACAALVLGGGAAGRARLVTLGFHAALLLNALFLAIFAAQTLRAKGVPSKADRLPTFVALTIGSAASLVALVAFKPTTKAKRV